MRFFFIFALLLTGCQQEQPPEPTVVVVERDASKEWEQVTKDCDRLKVEGGWLYRTWGQFKTYGSYDCLTIAVCYVPAPVTATAWSDK